MYSLGDLGNVWGASHELLESLWIDNDQSGPGARARYGPKYRVVSAPGWAIQTATFSMIW